jgi:hypothetical protein
MKPAADAATTQASMKFRRENPVFFMSLFLSRALPFSFSFLKTVERNTLAL